MLTRQCFLGTLTISDGLQNIREYLDQDGAILSGHQEFITYFALPFVSEPHLHPSYDDTNITKFSIK